MTTADNHTTGRDWTDHLSDVSGDFKECWCFGPCCEDAEGRCICPECCCDDDAYWEQFGE